MRTVLLFALPEEHAAFRKTTGPWRLSHRTPFKTFHRTTRSGELVLVETGMGQGQLCKALPWVLEHMQPDLIICTGFAGSLSQTLAVGDVCLVEALVCLDEDRHPRLCPEIAGAHLQDAGSEARDGPTGDMEDKPSVTFHLEHCAEIVSRWLQVDCDHRLHQTRIVTVTQPQPKALLARKFADSASLMDMESYYAVRFCVERRIPFLGIRAVSDGLGDEIDFDLNAICDERGRVSLPRVVTSVMRSPGLIRSYYHSWKRSRTAARSLGKVLTGLVARPVEELEALAESLSHYTS